MSMERAGTIRYRINRLRRFRGPWAVWQESFNGSGWDGVLMGTYRARRDARIHAETLRALDAEWAALMVANDAARREREGQG